MSEIFEVIERIIGELRFEGMNFNIMLVGLQFIEYLKDVLKQINFKIYRIEEFGYDVVIVDFNYLGQIKKVLRRVFVEFIIEEKEVWNEIKNFDV